mgnify:CR=1 FL=1
MSKTRIVVKIFIPFILFFLFFFELFSFISSKLNLLIFNNTPKIYLQESKFSVATEWRDEKNIWGAWHKIDFQQSHQSDCFDVIYKTNNIGARDAKFSINEKKIKKTFILLGDSMMEGYGLNKDEMFENIIEKENNLNVLNFASGGDFGPLQYHLIYQNMAKNFKHDGIILVYFPQNDLTDNNYEIWKNNGWNKFNDLERHRPYSIYKNNGYNHFIPVGAKKSDHFQYEVNERRYQMIKFLINYTWSANSLRTLLYLYRSVGRKNQNGNIYKDTNYSSFYDFNKNLLDENIYWMKSIFKNSTNLENYLIILPSKNDMKTHNKYKNQNNIAKELMAKFDSETYSNLNIINLINYLPNDYEKILLKCDDHYSFYGNQWISNIFKKYKKR